MAPRFTHYESGSLFLFGKEGKEKKITRKKKKKRGKYFQGDLK